MPFYIRAKTYLRYAEEEYKKALKRISEDREAALSAFRDSFCLAAKAIWAISQVEAPKESPPPETLLEGLSQAVEPEKAAFFKEAWRKFVTGISPEEAKTLALQALNYTREVLAPILGPPAWSRNF